jgi:hypothetical protein
MAIQAATVWEVRTTGSQTNGGGFYNRNPGTSVDYSQQNTAVLSLSDIATDGAGTGVSSATGGFTAAMVGNIIYLTGGGSTPGWYEIVAFASANAVTIDRNAGLNKSSVTGNVGGAFKLGGSLDSDFFAANQKVAGNVVWIKSGTYSIGEIITISVNAANTATIAIEGYNAARGDIPTGTNRPLLDFGPSYRITMNGAYWTWRNISFLSGSTQAIGVDSNTILYNCKVVNDSSSATPRYGANITSNGSLFISCEFTSVMDAAARASGSQNGFINCYMHDSVNGLITSNPAHVIGCVIANCLTYGWNGSYAGQTRFHGNVIYNCGTGIHFSGITIVCSIINNIVSGCGIGMSMADTYFNFIDFNCWYNTSNFVNVTAGPHDILADPLMVSPETGDFTLGSGSPCFDAGIQLGAIVGL